MIIRPASTKDCQAIYALYQNEKWISFTEEKVISLFSTNLSHYLVVEENQKILGFARYLTDEVMTTFLAVLKISSSISWSVLMWFFLSGLYVLNNSIFFSLMNKLLNSFSFKLSNYKLNDRTNSKKW